jgi:ornithine cyclodeaminase/alanine dehydrogenase-like protein (mu-crystallin family)
MAGIHLNPSHRLFARARTALGGVIAGTANGRTRPDDITIFDSSGTGIQDVAAAARAYELAQGRHCGSRIELA